MVDIVNDIKSALKSAEPLIYDILTKDFRDDLNKNIHVLDLSYDTLLSSTYSRLREKLSPKEQVAYNTAYESLINVLVSKSVGRTVPSISDPLVGRLITKDKATGKNIIRGGPILIHDGKRGPGTRAFLVGSQFSSLQKYYSFNIAEDPSLKRSRFGKSIIYKQKKDGRGNLIPDDYTKSDLIKVEFGHIPTADDQNLTSPLIKKLQNVISATTNPLIIKNAEQAINDLYNIQLKITHRFKNVTPEAIAASRNILGEGYIVVTLQSSAINKKFSAEETKVYSKLLRSIANNIDYGSIKGSNTIKQDIAQGIASVIAGKKGILRKHNSVSATTTTNIKAKTKGTISSGSGFTTVTTPRKVLPTSIINLEAILRARINEQVRQNMGDGNESRILNYRTGRFTESVSIERLSESRQGMITVFYNYMKNPYATFSEGGRQQYPKTRDPKLLISKSIREIAAPYVSNRLRSVVV